MLSTVYCVLCTVYCVLFSVTPPSPDHSCHFSHAVALTALGQSLLAFPYDAAMIPHPLPYMYRSYQADQVTDLTEAELINEVIREKLFNNLHKEVPYQIVQSFRLLELNKETNEMRIDQDIIVPTRSHVKMLLGERLDGTAHCRRQLGSGMRGLGR
jgi:GTPase Era involved in 16S rRNA processing